ncbi:uncharacterized protein TNCV_4811061 [Trichonephila clavipes]|nr:uncharacterized protein TNCV_4811061 [Trichonephila clavipes]
MPVLEGSARKGRLDFRFASARCLEIVCGIIATSTHSQQFLTAHSERSTWPATWRVDQPAVFILMMRPLSNSLNCEKCLLARLPGMFRFPKSSYNRRVIIPFMKLRICLFLVVAPPRCV